MQTNNLKIRHFERGLLKAINIKKLNLFFLSNPVPFNGQNKKYEKQKRLGIRDQLFFRLQNKFRKLPLLVMYYLTKFDYVI